MGLTKRSGNPNVRRVLSINPPTVSNAFSASTPKNLHFSTRFSVDYKDVIKIVKNNLDLKRLKESQDQKETVTGNIESVSEKLSGFENLRRTPADPTKKKLPQAVQWMAACKRSFQALKAEDKLDLWPQLAKFALEKLTCLASTKDKMHHAGYNGTIYNRTIDDWSLNDSAPDHCFTHYDHERDEYVHFLVKISNIFQGIISVLGIIGNGLVIWIAGFRMKKTISAVWFLNLAIADFLCCMSLPLRIAQWDSVFNRKYCTMFTLCKISIVLFTANMSASILVLTAMSIDRCVSVMWPLWAKVHRTRRLVRITAGGIWVLSLLLSVLAYYSYQFHVLDVNEWCVIHFHSYVPTSIMQTILLIRLLIMFVIPFLTILISYLIIFLKLRKTKRPQRSQRPYRIITAVILCFFICWSPYYIWPVAMSDRFNLNFYIPNTIFIILAVLNSCLNPIIYVFMGQGFRQGFLRSILARVKGALSELPDDLCEEREDGGPAHTRDV
ncbi:formyl peptide receptor-related sequence 4-like [Leptodactylus fuscus]